MSKKVIISLIVAMLAALVLSSVALAGEDPGRRGSGRSSGRSSECSGRSSECSGRSSECSGRSSGRSSGRRGYGEITAVSAAELTLKTLKGETFSVQLEGETVYRESQGALISQADLKVGQKVAVAAVHGEEDTWVARLVIVLPEDFDPSQRPGRGAAGMVTAVNAESFSLQSRRGDELTFVVDEGTQFPGYVKNLAELEIGMHASVAAMKNGDGSLVALSVWARPVLVKRVGTVTAVDTGSSTLTLEDRRGEEITFLVNEETRFRSKNGEITGLEDIEVGMVAIILAVDEDGTYVAVGVGAADGDDLPKFDVKNAGKIVSIDSDSFTIKIRSGDEVTFLVTDETRFRSRGGKIDGFEDLKKGMIVGVGGEETADGSYIARVVLVVNKIPKP